MRSSAQHGTNGRTEGDDDINGTGDGTDGRAEEDDGDGTVDGTRDRTDDGTDRWTGDDGDDGRGETDKGNLYNPLSTYTVKGIYTIRHSSIASDSWRTSVKNT